MLPCSKKVKTLPDLSETVLPAQKGDVLELDELWSFVRRKDQKRWVWLALCRRTRQIVAYAIGDRSEVTCRILWSRLPKGYRPKRTYTDFWHAYKAVVPVWHHWPVGKDEGQTNHIERFNNTLRQRLGRFTRKTLSFSKCDQMHEMCLRLFLYDYNQTCRKLLLFRQT